MSRLITLLGLLAVSGLTSLYAQNIRATIPFEFQVAGRAMPAGDYVISAPSQGFLLLKNADGRNAILALANAAHRAGSDNPGQLQFTRYEGVYFLSKVWAPGAADGRSMPQSTHEKELAARTKAVETAGIPARVK